MFGKRKASANGMSYSSFGSNPISVSRSKSAVVPNLDASAALSYLLSPNAKLSVGYRVDAYFNAFDTGNQAGASEGDRIIHGPFAKFTVEFGSK